MTRIAISYTEREIRTWLLNAAIESPNCIICANSFAEKVILENEYKELLSQKPWYQRCYSKLFGRKNPRFVTKDTNIEGVSVPVIIL